MEDTFQFDGKTILVTGGTGSFGKRFIRNLLAHHKPKKVIVLSRDELKQHEMRQDYPEVAGSPLRFFIGDVRDKDRLERAFHGVDLVVHAAALKQVPACEYNPFEAILTNVIGAKNIIDAAIDQGVGRVVALSTDKAVNPVNLYGATKLCSEKLFVQGNAYAGISGTRFACVRYGNVVGSRGSVIPLFREQARSGRITVTDSRMTRFWITLNQGVDFVMSCARSMRGGEVFVPKIPSMNIMDLAAAIAPECAVDTIGIRPGEKLHEALISEDESRCTYDLADRFVVLQQYHPTAPNATADNAKCVEPGFKYSSDNNPEWLGVDDLKRLIAEE